METCVNYAWKNDRRSSSTSAPQYSSVYIKCWLWFCYVAALTVDHFTKRIGRVRSIAVLQLRQPPGPAGLRAGLRLFQQVCFVSVRPVNTASTGRRTGGTTKRRRRPFRWPIDSRPIATPMSAHSSDIASPRGGATLMLPSPRNLGLFIEPSTPAPRLDQ